MVGPVSRQKRRAATAGPVLVARILDQDFGGRPWKGLLSERLPHLAYESIAEFLGTLGQASPDEQSVGIEAVGQLNEEETECDGLIGFIETTSKGLSRRSYLARLDAGSSSSSESHASTRCILRARLRYRRCTRLEAQTR